MPTPEDQLPVEPTHTMRRIARTLDRVRGKVAALGLRPYRVFYIREAVPGDERVQGGVEEELEFYEFTPPPRVRNAPPRVGTMAGVKAEGSLRIDRVSRDYKREQIVLRGLWGDAPGRSTTHHIGLLAEGQLHVELYVPSSEPLLTPFGWSFGVTAINRRVPLGSVLPWPA